MQIGGPSGVAIGTLLFTIIVLLFADSAPKTIACYFSGKDSTTSESYLLSIN